MVYILFHFCFYTIYVHIYIINDVKEAYPLMKQLSDKNTYALLENDLPDIFNE